MDCFRGEFIGPLVKSTRAAYELKLARLIANIAPSADKLSNCFINFVLFLWTFLLCPRIAFKVHLLLIVEYSWALEQWIAGHQFPEGAQLDELVFRCFAGFSGEYWREGTRPTSFCYILIGNLKELMVVFEDCENDR